MANEEKFKTGEEAPESGTYVFESYVNNSDAEKPDDDEGTVDLGKGERFPPTPSTNKAAYWVKQ
ncbi:YjzC family protein [Pseudalkalibacillus caeni]|uniref:YjzC family protein n=1 Tax=Exobacillus caeni TaxID=2574798 RepID=A0A5R9F187_9BACL|nr:YjzC family protein [Pseudalkalibacillus caeni]TLS36190.1 YjzC family protein [Pseudalkalibacillus caeni]